MDWESVEQVNSKFVLDLCDQLRQNEPLRHLAFEVQIPIHHILMTMNELVIQN